MTLVPPLRSSNPPGITRSGQPCQCACHAFSASGRFGRVRHIVACCQAPWPPEDTTEEPPKEQP